MDFDILTTLGENEIVKYPKIDLKMFTDINGTLSTLVFNPILLMLSI